jgi:hypothetical protein
MKRSEMIEKIQDYYNKQKIRTLNEYREEGEVDAETVLDLIESLGMEPPYSDAIFQKEAKTYIFPNGNKWEKEE